MTLQTLTKPIFWTPWLAVAIISYFFADLPITIFLYSVDQQHHWLTLLFTQINHLGTGTPYLAVSACIFLWAFFIKKNRHMAWTAGYFFLAIAVSGIICNVFKIVLGRARPVEFFSDHLYGFYFWKFDNHFWSMPSGHATVITAAATAGYLILKRWGWLFLLAIALVFFGRIMCRAHYLSDVMVGGYIGFLVSYQLKQKSSAGTISALD